MTESKRRGLPTGVVRKHSRKCPTYTDKNARCRGGRLCKYQVQAGPRGNRQTYTAATVDEAVNWKRDIENKQAAGKLARARAPTLQEAFELWKADAIVGVAMARGNKRFRGSTIHGYNQAFEAELKDTYGP